MPAKVWYTYILQCVDDSLYTGITTDLDRRLSEHNTSNKGAKYTRTRRPVILKYWETFDSRSTASQREYEIKQLSRKSKLNLINKHDEK